MSDRMKRTQKDRAIGLMLKKVILVLAVVLAVGFIYFIGRSLFAAYNQSRLETTLAEYGALKETLRGDGLVLHRETIFKAPAAGFFENTVDDGKKVSAGMLLGYYTVKEDKTPLHAAVSGIFTRRTDGLEEVLQNLTLAAAGPGVFSYRPQQHDPAAEFKPDQTVYKIVGNLEPTRMILQFPLGQDVTELQKDQTATLSVKGRVLGECTVIDYKKDFNKLVILVEFPVFREDLLNTRQIGVDLIFTSPEGYLVPEKSLLVSAGEKGIYCVNGERIIFKTVQVLTIKNGTALVEGLQTNDMVVVNPERVKL
ncbi:MAG TPA: HlyD family efflux transporter periplasmic adaptor subunit [Syntrophomonas sp.]|nr:HlyD family efflux transporter periplasmic adaptor subunit [Syntrophomonas sp.]